MKALKENYHMNDKAELLDAIDNYTVYTPAQRTLLKTLINISIDNIVSANVADLSKLSGITKLSIYKYLKIFFKENLLEKIPGPNKALAVFKINNTRLDEIRQIHNKKSSILKK